MAPPSASRSISAKKAATKTTAAKKTAAKKSTEPKLNHASKAKTAARKAPAEKSAAKRTSAKRSPAKKTAAKKTAAKKTAAKKTAGKKPAAKKTRSPFSAAFLKRQQELLTEERATYIRQAETLQAEAEELVADFVSGDSQFDEDGGEGDSLSSERERDLALSAQARAAVEEIDHALAKFETGTYGICEASGEPIPEERLEAIPWARVQIQYKTGGLGRP